jgi:hypothetical protein
MFLVSWIVFGCMGGILLIEPKQHNDFTIISVLSILGPIILLMGIARITMCKLLLKSKK